MEPPSPDSGLGAEGRSAGCSFGSLGGRGALGRWGEPPSATFQEPPSNACDFSGDRRGIFLIKGVRRMLAGPWRPISLSSLCPVPCWHCCHVPSPGVPRKQWPRPACAGPGLTPLGAGGGGGGLSWGTMKRKHRMPLSGLIQNIPGGRRLEPRQGSSSAGQGRACSTVTA